MWKGHKVEVAVLSSNVRVVSARDDPPSALAHHLGSCCATLWTLPPQRCTRDDARGRKEEEPKSSITRCHRARRVLSRRLSGRRPRVEGSCGA